MLNYGEVKAAKERLKLVGQFHLCIIKIASNNNIGTRA